MPFTGRACRLGAPAGVISSTGGAVSNISGIAGLTVTAGTTTLSGSNTYGGLTDVGGGVLTASAANAFSSGSETWINTLGAIDLGGFDQTINSVISTAARFSTAH